MQAESLRSARVRLSACFFVASGRQIWAGDIQACLGNPPPTDWGRKGQGWGHEGITQVTWAGTDVSILSLI